MAMIEDPSLYSAIKEKYSGKVTPASQPAADNVLTLWISGEDLPGLLQYLKSGIDRPFRMLYDLTAIDERRRSVKRDPMQADFTIVYHLTSL
jgi:NADH-quinone oxidoreductase subunit C/D